MCQAFEGEHRYMSDLEKDERRLRSRPDYKHAERRHDQYGEMRLMSEAEGFVMVRRKGCAPFVITRVEWDNLSKNPIC